MTDAAVSLVHEPADTPESLALQEAFVAEVVARYADRGVVRPPIVGADEVAEPAGRWVVVRLDGRAVACGGLRPFADGIVEVKRVYVAPEARGRGLSRRLMEHLHEQARAAGYRTLRLDTGDRQAEAQALYRSLGYREIPDYNGNRLATLWFERAV
ncbi:GNAT family N-acetyltransferase [Patulibacter sp. SYSU D01012]|uniref:GNAT family N-acetyltransferase n=1 Tax=Patulibacter sp. SYSU D01012 TaxID=2817381 RepID=UPI001B309792